MPKLVQVIRACSVTECHLQIGGKRLDLVALPGWYFDHAPLPCLLFPLFLKINVNYIKMKILIEHSLFTLNSSFPSKQFSCLFFSDLFCYRMNFFFLQSFLLGKPLIIFFECIIIIHWCNAYVHMCIDTQPHIYFGLRGSEKQLRV